MKNLSCFTVFIVFVSVSLLKSQAKTLRLTPSNQDRYESIANLIYKPLQNIQSSFNKESEDTSAEKIPVYFIVSPKSHVRTETKEQSKDEENANMFDEKGMYYITKPKAVRNGQSRISILDDMAAIDRRSYSTFDLTRKNKRALKSFVNEELNKKLIAKNNMRRFLDKYDKEYNFNDLVM